MTLDIRTHDIANQLAVIEGFAELLLADADAADPRRDDLEQIREAAVAARDLLAGGMTSVDTTPRPPPGIRGTI